MEASRIHYWAASPGARNLNGRSPEQTGKAGSYTRRQPHPPLSGPSAQDWTPQRPGAAAASEGGHPASHARTTGAAPRCRPRACWETRPVRCGQESLCEGQIMHAVHLMPTDPTNARTAGSMVVDHGKVGDPFCAGDERWQQCLNEEAMLMNTAQHNATCPKYGRRSVCRAC